ncbi:thiol-disulfide oxidoreductase ResA [Sporosarcina pasteurii]|uniref:Thiol-disulfide oxidoreductase resA n=1 Tax=Sporosarcina pasteurii TaxID=1474 RepID=A0A380BLB0_SPOPA|nr:thiol-disulfide oxidoreductase ResA [Sporosarcina pasteurii]MDS9470789.1 thiol-disulfide oxidoreductase ResA [Sporosarcina pasteurii]QBQ05542.1 thiol-disulfide oxidoreductase ResA [Sporosarcina pasteurii]SUJ02304.1 Thiol-disulfide oxidoreductase resA [Sporosarcina pasteurii]
MSKAEQFAKKRKVRLVIRTVVLFLLLGAVIFAIVSKDTEKVLAVGDKAPDFELVDLEGNIHKLSEYEGEGVFLNFWGSWCPPCKEEMPFMENQSKEFEDKGVHILAINIKDTRLKAETFRDQYGLTFPIAQDKDESVRRAYNVIPLPTTILINKDGVIEDIITTGLDEEEIRQAMESIQPE